jgi:hypothetical protein
MEPNKYMYTLIHLISQINLWWYVNVWLFIIQVYSVRWKNVKDDAKYCFNLFWLYGKKVACNQKMMYLKYIENLGNRLG